MDFVDLHLHGGCMAFLCVDKNARQAHTKLLPPSDFYAAQYGNGVPALLLIWVDHIPLQKLFFQITGLFLPKLLSWETTSSEERKESYSAPWMKNQLHGKRL